MKNRSTIERLSLPMFVCGVIAMVASAGISLGTSANAASPVQYKKVTLNYLSTGYSTMDSACGMDQDVYSATMYGNGFRARNMSTSSSDKTFRCTATFYMVTNVTLPSPKPIPTVTISYRPQPTGAPRPTRTPTSKPTGKPSKKPTPSPSATRPSYPMPSFSPSPSQRPNWWQRPTPTPTKKG